MTISTSFDKLSNVRAAFDSWRNQSERKRQIPKELWLQAVSLLDLYPISRVASELRLNQARLREQQATFKPPQPLKNQAKEELSFIQMNQLLQDNSTSTGFSDAALQLQIERADGTRLTLSIPASETNLVQALFTSYLAQT